MSKKTLVIGATPNSTRYAFIATKMLMEYHHAVVPFGIKKGNIEQLPIVNNWPADEDFDTVTLYINADLQKAYFDKIIALKPQRVIFNPGTENQLFENLLIKNNITPVKACTLVMLRTNQY